MTLDNTSSTSTNAAGSLAAPGLSPSGSLLGSVSLLGDEAGLVHPSIQEQLSGSGERDADIVVIGSGPAGYVAAIRAAQLGAKVVIVEKNSVGGTCLNVGCIPTKVLLACVGTLEAVKKSAEFGVNVSGWDIDLAKMVSRKDSVVKRLVGGVEALLGKNKVRIVRGEGRITEPNIVSVDTAEGVESIRTDKILICTGSSTALLPLPGLEVGENVWTSTEALCPTAVPKSLLIIGAGAIGLEAGYTYAKLGTEVLIVEMMPQILPAADKETADELMKSLKKAGIKFMLGASASRAEDIPGGKRVFIKNGDKEETLEFEKILVAVGRRANIKGIGLDEVGIKHDKRKILVDEHMRTNIPNIFAAGDCIGEPMLAHVGWTESIVAVENAMGINSKMSYNAFPACVYTTPESASVGLTEAKARERYKEVKIGKFTFKHNGKAMGIGETDGFIKIITEPKYGEILGVHMVGPHVTDLITEAVIAMRNELTVDEMIATIHPHPTLAEVVQEAAYDARGRAIHK